MLKQEFWKYLDEIESYSSRSERLFSDIEHAPTPEKRRELVLVWMEAAFNQGARVVALDVQATLGDYATAMAGIDTPLYTAEQAFDVAAENLKDYLATSVGC